MSKVIRHKVVFGLLLLYWPALFLMMHLSPGHIGRFMGSAANVDKVLHFFAYFLLTFLLWFSFSSSDRVNWKTLRPWLVMTAVVAYAVMDEFTQQLTGRSMEGLDLVSDIAGAVAAFVLMTVYGFMFASVIVVSAGVTLFFVLADRGIVMVDPLILNALLSGGFGFLTLVWSEFLRQNKGLAIGSAGWKGRVFVIPVLVLCFAGMISYSGGFGLDSGNFLMAVLGVFFMAVGLLMVKRSCLKRM